MIDTEAALDPANPSKGVIYEIPHNKLTVAFWFSPDSTKLLCLTASGKTRVSIELRCYMDPVLYCNTHAGGCVDTEVSISCRT